VPSIALIEGSAYKRRWYRPDYAEEERQALELWLVDCIEVAARERGRTFSLEQMVAALQDDSRVLAVCEVLAGRRDFSLSQLVDAALQSDAVPSHRFHVYKATGLDKRAVWERTWEEQRREDAGENVTPEVPPAYTQADFLKPDYFRLRGKLDVPKERFIAFTEVPGRTGADALYGWAGWTSSQRLKALISMDEELEDGGVPLAERAGLLDSAWRLLPEVAREDANAAVRLKAELQALVGPEGPSRELVDGWHRRSRPPSTRAKNSTRAKKQPAVVPVETSDEDEEPSGAGALVPLWSARITNFRAIREETLYLDPKVTVLFGANAAGKTTFLDAVAIALGALVSRVPKSASRDFATTGDIRVPWRSRPDIDEQSGVECAYTRIELSTVSGIHWDVTRFRSAQDKEFVPDGLGTKALQTVIDPLVSEALNVPKGTPTQPIPLVAAYSNERARLDVPPRELALERDLSRFHGLDQSLSAKARFKSVFEWFQVAEDEERRERERRQDFKYRLPDLEWVRRVVRKAELRCLNPRLETRPLRMVVDFDHGNGEIETLDVNALSDGYRTQFSLVVDLARRMVQLNPSPDLDDRDRGTNTRAVVLIDEIDLHLDPSWQGRVVKGLIEAFPNTQFILTTHSEQVLGSVRAECVRKLVWGDGEILIENVPFAQGATGERILIDLMGAPERVPGPVTDTLKKYLKLVDTGEGHSEEAKELRSKLEQELPSGDSMLRQAELEMQRRELMAKFGGKAR
jgi:predicted ATP-binding protein involved in virulence